MEAISSSETSIYFQRTTQHYIPEDSTLRLSDALRIRIDVNQGGALWSLLFSFSIEDTSRKVQETRAGLELKVIHEFRVYAGNINLLDRNIGTTEQKENEKL
jgi:hypothetical protein